MLLLAEETVKPNVESNVESNVKSKQGYKYQKILLEQYFKNHSLVESNIVSFNHFIDKELKEVIKEIGDIEPTIIPQNVDSFKVRFDNIYVGKPEIVEADGSKRPIYPTEARLRKLSYTAPCFIEVSTHINGVQRETFTTQIANLPIMLKSKQCYLSKFSSEELIAKGEDPNDSGGYFIINGSERVLIQIEDLAANKFLVEEKRGVFTGKLFSEKGPYKILHTFEKGKSGLYYLSFTRAKRIPIILLLKALGLFKDEGIMKTTFPEGNADEVLINLYQFAEMKTPEDAMDQIAKTMGMTQAREVRLERVEDLINKFLFPHLGTEPEDKLFKAHNLCKYLRRFVDVSSGRKDVDDKDHYSNKRLKMSGDLLADLFRTNLRALVSDLLYNFQRMVKRGKFPSLKVIIREKLLTQKLYSAMATGSWVGGRKGVSQRIQRMNFLDTMSHLQRVVSPLSSSQENFEARELHATHLGRLCPIETPEGTNIGLRKNLSLLSQISTEGDEEKILKSFESFGLEPVVKIIEDKKESQQEANKNG